MTQNTVAVCYTCSGASSAQGQYPTYTRSHVQLTDRRCSIAPPVLLDHGRGMHRAELCECIWHEKIDDLILT